VYPYQASDDEELFAPGDPEADAGWLEIYGEAGDNEPADMFRGRASETSTRCAPTDAVDVKKGERARPGDVTPPAFREQAAEVVMPPAFREQAAEVVMPPAASEVSSAARGSTLRAEAVVVFPLGKISFYKGTGSFECVCSREGHVDCRLTRTSLPSVRAARAGQGRPLGLLASWLLFDGELHGKAEHRNPFTVLGLTRELRSQGRHVLRGLPNGAQLEACERPRRASEEESSEPEDVP